jgi:hypothetical protein
MKLWIDIDEVGGYFLFDSIKISSVHGTIDLLHVPLETCMLANPGGVSEINDLVNKFLVLSQERVYTCWDD